MPYLFYRSSQGFFGSHSGVTLPSFIWSSIGPCSVIFPFFQNIWSSPSAYQDMRIWNDKYGNTKYSHILEIGKYGKTKSRCRAETCRHFRWYNAALCFLQEFPFEFLLPCCYCWFIGPKKLPCISLYDSHAAIWDFSLPNLTTQSCQPTPGITISMFLGFPGLFCRRMPQSGLEFPFPAHSLCCHKALIVFWKEHFFPRQKNHVFSAFWDHIH